MLGTMIASGEVLEDFAEPSSFPAGISSDSVMVVVALVLLSTTDPSGISTTVVAAAVALSVDALVVVVTVSCADVVAEDVLTFDSADGVACLVVVADVTCDGFVVGVTLVVDVLVENCGVEDGATADVRDVVVCADGVAADVLAFLVEVDGVTSDDFVGGVTLLV